MTEIETGTLGVVHHMQPPGKRVFVPALPIAAVPPLKFTPRVFEACALQISR